MAGLNSLHSWVGGMEIIQINKKRFSVGDSCIIDIDNVKDIYDVLEEQAMESASAFFEVLGISGLAIKELLEGNAKLEVVDDDKREQAEFSLKFLDAAGKVVLITGGALRQLMVTKLKALDKASAKVKLDEYYKFMRFVDVLGQLGANVRATQWRRASIKTLVGSNVERALRYFSSSETPDGCGVLAILRTQKFKIGAGAAGEVGEGSERSEGSPPACPALCAPPARPPIMTNPSPPPRSHNDQHRRTSPYGVYSPAPPHLIPPPPH